MAKSKSEGRVPVLSNIPAEALRGMHPTTKRMIGQIKAARVKLLTFRLKDAREAKNRLDALRRARKRGYVRYKEAHQQGRVLWFGLK